MRKKGSVLLYVIFAILGFSIIISYIILRTGTSQISQLAYTSKIIQVYRQNYNSEVLMMQQAFTPPEEVTPEVE